MTHENPNLAIPGRTMLHREHLVVISAEPIWLLSSKEEASLRGNEWLKDQLE